MKPLKCIMEVQQLTNILFSPMRTGRGYIMNYNTGDYKDILTEIKEEINRIDNEVDIFKYSHEENVFNYNKLVNVVLILKKIV